MSLRLCCVCVSLSFSLFLSRVRALALFFSHLQKVIHLVFRRDSDVDILHPSLLLDEGHGIGVCVEVKELPMVPTNTMLGNRIKEHERMEKRGNEGMKERMKDRRTEERKDGRTE